MSQLPDHEFDAKRVAEFLGEFMKFTGHGLLQKRIQKLDKRIDNAALSLADKIEAFKRLAPRRDATGFRKELRMERLLLSVARDDLPMFKFVLEYDGDYKDMAEYVFHDIDNKQSQTRIIKYFGTLSRPIGVKVLSDVDDTMYANLVDERYPKNNRVYPGVLEFYDSLKQEPFALSATPVTTLSARPRPWEEKSIERIVKLTEEKLCPSALSGELVSSAIGTLETFVRANLDRFLDQIPHGQEDQIGVVKFENFANFSAVYPEYRYVFVGDSGQADALSAQLMLAKELTEASSRVITTFIHDLRQSEDDGKSASHAFKNLPSHVLITKTSAAGRGVIIFRNYIDAAVIAHRHSATLGNLVTAEGLAKITKAALEQFKDINFRGKEDSGRRLREQYRQDAEAAYGLLTMGTARRSAFDADVAAVRRILDEGF